MLPCLDRRSFPTADIHRNSLSAAPSSEDFAIRHVSFGRGYSGEPSAPGSELSSWGVAALLGVEVLSGYYTDVS